MQSLIAQLAATFPLSGLRFELGRGGLVKAVVRTGLAEGEVYLYGAHVTHFQPLGESPVLWISDKSIFESGKPIRGGVPICFPWFGAHRSDAAAPLHGRARIRHWNLIAAQASDDGAISLTFRTSIDDFVLTYRVSFGRALTISLRVALGERAPGSVSFEEALHTYYSIAEIRRVLIEGLESARYIDKVDGEKQKPATHESIQFDGECDRIYLGTTATCVLHDLAMGRSIEIRKSNSQCTVVWNPWVEKSAAMPDFGDDEWRSMVCIETANVGPHAITLWPGDAHVMTAEIGVIR
ncbi:MAG: D-hexose-6-phosphate mutarotase [Novipirellula sp. JB048]